MAENSKVSKKRAKLARVESARANRKRENRNFRQDFPSKRSGLLISFRDLRLSEQTYNTHQKNRQIVDGNFSVYVFKKKSRQSSQFFYLKNVYLLFKTIKCDGN